MITLITIVEIVSSNNGEIFFLVKNEDGEFEKDIVGNYWLCRDCGNVSENNAKPKRCSTCLREVTDNRTRWTRAQIKSRGKRFDPFETLPSNKWNPLEYNEYEPVKVNIKDIYNKLNKILHQAVEFNTEIEYKIVTLWIMATWKKENFSTSGLLAFLSDKPNRGKSTALKIVEKFSYRSADMTGKTGKQKYDLGKKYNCTIIIDNVNTTTEMTTFLDTSYKQLGDSSIFVALSGIVQFQESTKQRVIPIYMPKGTARQVSPEEISTLKRQLLDYRLYSPKPQSTVSCPLDGRVLELFNPILCIAESFSLDKEDIINFAKNTNSDSLIVGDEYKILSFIKQSKAVVFATEILKALEWEDSNNSRVELGYLLRDMGLTSTRSKKGRRLSKIQNKAQLQSLYRLYKIK